MFQSAEKTVERRDAALSAASLGLDAAMIADIEAQAHVRTRALVLSPRLLDLYQRTTWRSRSHAMIDLSLGVIGFSLLGLIFDWMTVPEGAFGFLALGRLAIVLVYFAAIQGFRSSWGVRREGLLVIGPATFLLAVAGVAGLAIDAIVLERLLTNALFAIAAWILLASVAPRHTLLLVAVTIALTAGFMAVSPGHSPAEKLQMVAYYSIGAFALGQARLITNKVQQRLFVLDLSGRVRLQQVSALNARLFAAARTDALTGLPNRRAFDETFAALTEGPDAATPLCACVIDIDHFKRLNDLLGHERGDACLRAVAAALEGALDAPGATVARFGGEEFVALYPDCPLEDGVSAAERLRRAVRDLDLPNPGSPWREVTVSIGIAATSQAPASDLIRCADEALYQAKQLGRDRVGVYETFDLVASGPAAAA